MVVSKRTAIANIKKETGLFLEENMKHFIIDNASMEFYAMAVDVNSQNGMLSISLNTDFDFKKKLLQYRIQSQNDQYNQNDAIERLKFTTNEWHYQAFASMCPLNEDLYEHYFSQNFETYLDIITACLIEFKDTEAYDMIPKCDCFSIFCKAEEEPHNISLNRIKRIEDKMVI
ncbi:DUF4303 domain-containing protein [Erysipelothrix rhusiopathiae]|uniref:DUF4303 domain-containing protein n=1 Tax=Erysipelothrix rhusiopathiae ATCC 19414 TaxID=525280 RepID=E7FU95_ERYRH|nr:DUF4303 domain-containing protein [Erysipelothrix rhusiopathiae]AGN24092.1 hypothetical protein K210_02325 [Erysipelothrix rhusiopathiae SY1027]AMS11121.1 hypothetical protein A2I91_05065 [Erysipelothrix rhusiopathiae]AOO67619.1 DUF4303 domain-containing protein [Erysipelothrix rhusiopathiae]AWU41519.1 DUF4303 domain-containing protein [Erysipelothrix rhusiopathiae]EFY09636.1 hypothetical protein HMPREF0357_10431 [Erysipelothrix rhusiopathiae ATCC 19414]